MGGVIRINQTLKMYMHGDEIPSIYMGGDKVWEKPIRSMYPSREVGPTDDMLFIGSSDIGCLLGATWSPVPHDWPNIFRTNYAGTMNYPFEGRVRPGMASIISYGRTATPDILEGARQGNYPEEVNPFLSLSNYDTLVIDTSDLYADINIRNIYDQNEMDAVPAYNKYVRMGLPYQYSNIEHTDWLNREFEARMELLRMCSGAGVRKLFLMSPWPRLYRYDSGLQSPAGDIQWYNNYFQNTEDSMHYQQDRLNTQIEFEGLTTHVTLFPFHLMIKRIYEEIAAGTAPSILTSIRCLFANDDNVTPSDPLDDSIFKHYYMLNYYGGYAINCLYAAIAYKIDPRGRPRTDGTNTVDADSAAMFQEIAWDIAQTYGRAGQTRSNPGYVMPKLRPDPVPENILGDSLLYRGEDVAPGNHPFGQDVNVRHIIGVAEIDTSVVPSTGAGNPQIVLHIPGLSNMGPMLLFTNDNGTFNFSGGYADAHWGGPYMTTILDARFARQRAGDTTLIKVFFDVPMPYGTSKVNYGVMGSRFLITDVEGEAHYKGDTRQWNLGTNQPTEGLDPICNRLLIPESNVTLLDIMAIDHHMNDYEYQNIMRYLSIKHQSENIYDILTPDMITP